MKFKPLSNPIMIVGDNPSLGGGLSRIGRDLALLLCSMPEFRVAYLARGDGNRRAFPFTMYPFHESGEWGQEAIESAWKDFAGTEDGVILTTDDPSRRLWFSDPRGQTPELQKFLGVGRNFLKWGYFPVDSTGPHGMSLGFEGRAAVAGYDRVLAASEWGRDVLKASGRMDADWLPHGLDMTRFHPEENAKAKCGWEADSVAVGCVMANQARKDFPAAFECAAALKAEYGNRFKFWMNSDTMVRYWNVYAFAADYGLGDCIEVSMGLTDEELALRYSACDCTILPSAGEGFGYPIAESLACGTACIVTDYGAGQELVPEDCRVPPVTFRVDTIHNVKRAVISGFGFAQLAKGQIERKREDWDCVSAENAERVAHLSWKRLRLVWERYFREGLR